MAYLNVNRLPHAAKEGFADLQRLKLIRKTKCNDFLVKETCR